MLAKAGVEEDKKEVVSVASIDVTEQEIINGPYF